MSYEKKGGIFLKTCDVFLTLKMLEILHMEIKGMKVFLCSYHFPRKWFKDSVKLDANR